jgi:uroporphyrinogen decarboxylase
MTTVKLIEKTHGKLSLLLGSRPGVRYAGLTDRAVMESVESKVTAVEAFVERHNPDVILTIAGITSEAQSLGARIEIKDEGSPVVTGSPLRDKPDPSALRSVPLSESPLCASVIESIRILSERHPEHLVAATVNGPVTVTGLLIGLDRFLLLSVDNPELVRDIITVVNGRVIELMQAQLSAGAAYVHVAEPSGSLLSPPVLGKLGLPALRELFSKVEVPNHIHMCGNVSGHLEVLAETGAGAVSVDSMIDMRKAAEVFGPDIAVCGNIDTATILLRSTPEEVEAETRAMLERMAGVRAYIPAGSCGVPSQTPPENIDAFYSTVRGYGR